MNKKLLSPFLSEKEWQGQVTALAKQFRWLSYHTFDSRHSSKGFPDLVMVRGGRLIFAELKTDSPRSTLTSSQEEWIAQLSKVGDDTEIEVYVWRPAQWDEIVDILK